jgi:hypothetical protein
MESLSESASQSGLLGLGCGGSLELGVQVVSNSKGGQLRQWAARLTFKMFKILNSNRF